MDLSDLDANPNSQKDEVYTFIERIEKQIPAGKWKSLGRQLGFNEAELSHVEWNTRHHTIQDTIHQMLITWKQRNASRATIIGLATALQKEQLMDAIQQNSDPLPTLSDVSQIASHEELTSQEQAYKTKLEMRLRAAYQHLRLPGVPWGDTLILPMDDVYVELTMVEQDEYKTGKKAEIIELKNMFKPRPPRPNNTTPKATAKSLYLIVAGPGFGKTSTLKKLAYDWAEGEKYMEQFEIVIFAQLRHIQNSFRELMEEEAEIVNPPMPLFDLLDKIGNKVLVLLDGYDELPQVQLKDLDDLLRRKRFPDMTVVVSCRTVPTQTENETIFWNRLIEIKGFTEQRAVEFLAKYLTSGCVDEIWAKLNPVLRWKDVNLLCCPLFLLLFGQLLEDDKMSIVTNRTDLFKAAFNFMIQRSLIRQRILETDTSFDLFSFEDKSRWQSDPDQDSMNRKIPVLRFTESLWKHLKNGTSSFLSHLQHMRKPEEEDMLQRNKQFFCDVLSFGEFAWENLKRGKLYFERSELMKYCQNETVLYMGFLIESDKESKRRTQRQYYEPIHKTFMEFTAALHLENKAECGSKWDGIRGELQQLHDDVVVNLLSCFIFADELSRRKRSIIALLKDQLCRSRINFYTDVLLKMTPENEQQAIGLCREFDDMMQPYHLFRVVDQFLLTRFKLEQINLLDCRPTPDFGIPMDSISIESLVVTVVEGTNVETLFPKVKCKRIVIVFEYVDNESRLKQFSEIFDHFRNIYRQFPDIWLEIQNFKADDMQLLSSALSKIPIYSLKLYISLDWLPQTETLLQELDVTSDVILCTSIRSDQTFSLDNFKAFAQTLTRKTTIVFTDHTSCIDKYDSVVPFNDLLELNLPLTISTAKSDYLDNSAGCRLVEEIIIPANQIHQYDLSSWPNLSSLWLQDVSTSFDFSAVLDDIKLKAPRLRHLTTFVTSEEKYQMNTQFYPDLVLTVPKQQPSSQSRDERTIVDEVTIISLRYKDPDHHYQQLKRFLLSRQILRLYLTEDITTKYALQQYFPSPEFEISCIFRPHECIRMYDFIYSSYFVYMVTLHDDHMFK